MRVALCAFIAMAAAVCMLSGCMLGPDYHAPDVAAMNVPPEWKTGSPPRADDQQLLRWWQQFGDAELSALIDVAQTSSPTVASALLPTLSGNASRTRENFDQFVDESPDLNAVGQDIAGEANRTSAGLEAAWGGDLFGAASKRAMHSLRRTRHA
jgi:multidrug efflux system outer membrane protein